MAISWRVLVGLAFGLTLCSAIRANSADSVDGLIVPGSSNPWLAGMPNGSSAKGDTAPIASPAPAGITLTPGGKLHVAAAGSVNYVSSPGSDGPDGIPSYYLTNDEANGISGITATVNCLLGVFLDANQPDTTPAPDAMAFSTVPELQYLTLHPGLKQIFFIGDGVTDQHEDQEIVVPAGATRLYLGTLDGSGWFNNSGQFVVSIHPLGGSIFSTLDVHRALTLAAGLTTATGDDMARLNIETAGTSALVIDMADVADIARAAF